MRTRTKESARYVAAVDKALDILDVFKEHPRRGVAELARGTGLTRSRVMRLAGTLEARGYLSWEADGGDYRLGARLMALGKAFERHNGLIALARPILRGLVDDTGETASLYGADGLDRVVLAQEPGTRQVRYAVPEGERDALHAGAAGKVLLAFASEAVRARIFEGAPLARLTPATVVDQARLRDELSMIRRLGCGESAGERVADAWSTAAPVFDDSGRVNAAIGIAGPISRFTPDLRSHCRDQVVAAANTLSGCLGWTPEGKEPPS